MQNSMLCLSAWFFSVQIGAQNAKYYISAFYIYFKNFLKPVKIQLIFFKASL